MNIPLYIQCLDPLLSIKNNSLFLFIKVIIFISLFCFSFAKKNMPGATTVSKNRLELVKHFKQLGLPQTCDPSTRLTFDRLKAILLKPSTIHITQRLLCLACCSDVTPKDARTFLSAYIILCRPDMILQETPSSERIVCILPK